MSDEDVFLVSQNFEELGGARTVAGAALDSDGGPGNGIDTAFNESVHRGLDARDGTGADICRPHVF